MHMHIYAYIWFLIEFAELHLESFTLETLNNDHKHYFTIVLCRYDGDMGLKRSQSCVGSNLSSVSWTCFHFELSASNCSLEILDTTKQKITTIGCLRLIQNICVFKKELVVSLKKWKRVNI